MLGISIYPDKENHQQTIEYIKLAARLGFKRVFTCLLSINKDSPEVVKNQLQSLISVARRYGMEVLIDVAPSVFEALKIKIDDLKFFADLGVTGIRLDEGFNGYKEALMTHNPYGLDIEINMSNGTKQIDNILSYNANKKRIIACHNFYPMAHSGLTLEHFIKTSLHFKKLGIRSAAFVSSKAADHGPWTVMDDGLPTLEMHRHLPILTQVKHLLLLDLVDDIIIGNAFASKAELKAISELQMPVFDVEPLTNLNALEKQILFQETHANRGDLNPYMVRSSVSRIKFADAKIPANNDLNKFNPGEIIICNDKYLQYKGELQIIKQTHSDQEQRKNVVAKIVDHELFLLEYLKPWISFKLRLTPNSLKKVN